ncbi:sister chromatid cohesion protein PDS5 homolog A isoform X1 [Amborella trichopoda]|uniref:sister chromatid cohesion protein PDS5 homolog A isoform X1 n=2 Tax=Amborella trichopoda TaxID=13333 RepID=UPI0005D41A07|nr:sister chromatid cohesion protein PDS5 homolog A isoform X1 [Amborella trichopoda]|eukprot:XP_011628282.1 sister chromatid cohesion protein PDS5 homolog A isoform X1 [Amborella trichopoda]
MGHQLPQRLKEAGTKLENPPSSKDSLIKLLKQAATCLSELDQSPSQSLLESMQPCLNAIVKPELLKHSDKDVKLLVATCICEITRITAPEAPYSDDVLRDIFRLIVAIFGGLGDTNGPSFGRRVAILETVARYRSFVVMLDLECDDLVNDMFRTFLSVARDDYLDNVLMSMQTIMVLLLDESEDIQDELLLVLLSALGRGKDEVSLAARRLAMNVVEHCAGKLEPYVNPFLISALSGDKHFVDDELDYHEIIYHIYRCAPEILHGVVPYMTGELLTDQLDVRLKSVNLLGRLFALPGHVISQAYLPLFSEFLKRLTDRVVEVRISVVEHVKECLLSNPFRTEAPEIISALSARLLDYDENVRKEVVAAICDVANSSLKSIPTETIRLVAERLRDKSIVVKSYTMERLAEIYRLYCLKDSDNLIGNGEYDWIPGKLLRCFYDKDFRSKEIEILLSDSLFPLELSNKEKVRHWVTAFSKFEKVDVKALEQLLAQKHRLQQEMQAYLSLRLKHQDDGSPELQKRILGCFKTMSRSFKDPVKAEECFETFNQLKDANIWKILTTLLDSHTSTHQASTARADLLMILGDKHPLYDFMRTLSIKCSYEPFNEDLVEEIMSEVVMYKSSGDENQQLVRACMKLLEILSGFFPSLFNGTEESLVHLLKEDDDNIKEGIVHVLAKVGGVIRDQLVKTSSSVDLLLERLCLEGTRRQAKYSVPALAAVTEDDGLKALSVLYKRLVDMLEKKQTHLPAILQSLGCIAQIAMPVFETREEEVLGFIQNEVLNCSNTSEDILKKEWDERSDLCLLKIYGIKTLVMSYLPAKDAQLRTGIDKLLRMLKNILTFGELSEDIKSSEVDKAHLRLASAKAVLRLSKHWDHIIPVDVFHLVLRTAQDGYPQVRNRFLSKVHQYLKDRVVDGKYACAFLFGIFGSTDFKEDRHNIVEIVDMYRREVKGRHVFLQSNGNLQIAYPEHILSYLVHALVHHPAFPGVECVDVKEFEPVYRVLQTFLSSLVSQGEGQYETSAGKKQESLSAIMSIFHGIKCSEDVVDGSKSKNAHAICDLGLSIVKHLVGNEVESTCSSQSISLPSMLYRPVVRNEGDDSQASEEQQLSWLAGDDVVAQLHSLFLENEERVKSEVTKDGENLMSSDKYETEVPLGKIMRILKAHGTKKKNKKEHDTQKKNEVAEILPAERENLETDIDILGVIKEMGLDSLQEAKSLEAGKISDSLEDQANEGIAGEDKGKESHFVKKNVKTKKSKASKRGPKSRKRHSQDVLNETDDHSHVGKELILEEDKSEPDNHFDLSPSCLPTDEKSSTKSKAKGSSKRLKGNLGAIGDAGNGSKDSTKIHDSDKKIRKRKRKSITGLEKPSLMNASKRDLDLIGRRIQVWWPMDKEFYQGVVQSYDPGAKKHLVLYDDGDVENLRLDKEIWDYVEEDQTSEKQSDAAPSLSLSTDTALERKVKKAKTSAVSKEKKHVAEKSSNPRGRKRRNPGKNRSNGVRISEDTNSHDVERRGSSDVENAEQQPDSDGEEENSDDSGNKKESVAQAEKQMEESEDQPNSLKEESISEEEKVDGTESAKDSPQEQSVSEDENGAGTESAKGSGDSDNEPLSKWKLRAGKAV